MTKAQTMWNYIRRNPVFRAGDIQMVTGYSETTTRMYLHSWLTSGYIQIVKDARPIVERIYRLAKRSVSAPVRNDKGIAGERQRKSKGAKKMILEKQTIAEREAIAQTHKQVVAKRAEAGVVGRIQLASDLVKGKRANYSPSIVRVGVRGSIYCRETGKQIDMIDLERDGR
jgi:hypothetical protein